MPRPGRSGPAARRVIGGRGARDPGLPLFGWLERTTQKQLWRAVSDAVGAETPPPDGDVDSQVGELDLDPDLQLPAWCTDVDIHLQPDARRTGLESGSADVVSGTMLPHELPPEALGDVLVEAARLLAPAGVLRILDFQPTGDPIRDLAMVEHGQRNNEPYLPMLFATDVLELCRRASLVDARWVAFDERGTGRLDATVWPQRSEWHFPRAVLEARKPEENHA
ncbi:hypothetical protein GA0070563_102111 [Micromonospora carbonacea]|uniref:Methyltransferase domain-containing protein n=1 Tax=Micromonospora carbonacea TaxID=47853 RepID=A0A1C4V8A5_9ACTN|nr:hypothetical protein GA0070563_102111 [Micromonospora carbonacea]